MNSIATQVLGVRVNLPRAYLGQAELRLEPDSVTLIARPVRHYRALVVLVVCALAVLVIVGGLISTSGQIALREPGLSGPALVAARRAAYGAPLAIGVAAALLVWGMSLLLSAFRGDSRSMSVPASGVSIVKRTGRVLVMRAAFDPDVRSGNWTLVAANRDEASAIESALTSPGA